MRADHGSVPNAASCVGDRRREPVALREAAVVLKEFLDAGRKLILHADADGGPRAVVRALQERGKDPVVDMLNIRCISETIHGRQQDHVWMELLRARSPLSWCGSDRSSWRYASGRSSIFYHPWVGVAVSGHVRSGDFIRPLYGCGLLRRPFGARELFLLDPQRTRSRTGHIGSPSATRKPNAS